ncbi:hypothetical protein ACO0RG_000012 [Hanseniaspora osmophila]
MDLSQSLIVESGDEEALSPKDFNTEQHALSKANLKFLEESSPLENENNFTKDLPHTKLNTPDTHSYKELTVDEFFTSLSKSECTGPGDDDDAKSSSSVMTSTSSKRAKKYHCGFPGCNKSYSRPSQLTEHEQIAHKGQRNFVCSVCGNSYTKKVHLQRHQYTHGLKKPFSCSQCEKDFITRQQLVRHEKTHTKSFQCEQCAESFYKHSQLRSHVAKVHNKKNLACQECGIEFTKPQRLHAHMEIHHPLSTFQHSDLDESLKVTQYQCTILSCTKSFLTWSALQHHIKTDHPKLKCGICSKLCVGETGLQMHMMVHDESMMIKNWKCHLCSQTFAKKLELAHHAENVHAFKMDHLQNTENHQAEDEAKSNVADTQQPVANGNRRSNKLTDVDYLKAEINLQNKLENRDSMVSMLLNTIGKKYSCSYSGCYRKFKTKERFDKHIQKHKDYEEKLKVLLKNEDVTIEKS